MAQDSRSKHGGHDRAQGPARDPGSTRPDALGRARVLTLRALAWTAAAALAAGVLSAQSADRPARSRPAATTAAKSDKVRLNCPPPPALALPSGADATPVAWRDCADTPELIRLQGGRFLMGEQGSTGTLYERPVHEVVIAEFSIGKYEVSFAEWDECYRSGGCLTYPDDEGWGRGQMPVINVSWVDAQQFVRWLSQKSGKNYRLPSEAEWEYAARAGTSSRYSWGDGAEWACAQANVLDIAGFAAHPNWTWRAGCNDGYAYSSPVGSFPPNRWGLHDMNGNVWEWVQDCWHSDYTGAPEDGSAWTTGPECGKRVNRGGGWGNNPRSMRSASRDADSATGHSNAMGFRVARSP